MRRGIGIFAALAISVAAAFMATSMASAGDVAPDVPTCPTEEACAGPVEPCPPDVLCMDPIDCSSDDPTTCVMPICPDGETCSEPGCPPGVVCSDPGCPDDTACVDPPPCPDDMSCPLPPPCSERDCVLLDSDRDGWLDITEEEWGSDPDDASSTPEHGYIIETCMDGADNDGDGTVDIADAGCNIDSDGDGRLDPEDNCPWDANADQADHDGDGTGDTCDYDADNDGWDDFTEAEWGSNPNDASSTPEHWFAWETCTDGMDNDADGMTDAADPACAPDNDYDGVADDSDNCPTYWNPEQDDSDGDGTGDACVDSDGDGFFDGDETGWGSDPNDASNVPEGGVNWEACSDGVDNDADGMLDGEDWGCHVTAEDGSAPPSANGPFEPMPASSGGVQDDDDNSTPIESTSAPGLPLAGGGASRDGGPAWWLIAASIGALALMSGASAYGLRVRQRA